MTINVVCRKDAINRNHLAPLALVFTHDRRRKFVGLGISVVLEHWDFEKQQPTTDCPDGAEIQFQITSKIREYEKKIKKLEVLEIPVTFDTLFEQNGKRINCTVGEYFKQIIERLEKVEKYSSASKHKVTLVLVSQFRSVNMRFDELDLTYLREFEIFLSQKGNVNNSCNYAAFQYCRLYLIEILHQTTTHCKCIQFTLCCILSKFYIKPQHEPLASHIPRCCILSKFYIKPQQLREAHWELFRCILSKFYIKPQHLSQMIGPSSVVSYRNSTSNHNRIRLRFSERIVVSYRNSTSNHNKNNGATAIKMLYLIEILHQTTTDSESDTYAGRLYLIEILHQTTTLISVSSFSTSCILSKFYIKPQLPVALLRYVVVVSYRNSTSNHNSGTTTPNSALVVSYRNSTSNHNQNTRSIGRSIVVSYRNSTSNHNRGRTLCGICELYLIEILHQTTTPSSLTYSARPLYLIEILHQTTTTVAFSVATACCILSKFYIKPQPSRRRLPTCGVVSYRNSTSNHNIADKVLPVGQLYLIEILHQTTTDWRRYPRAGCCILSKFYIKPQRMPKHTHNSTVVSYRNSTSNHNCTRSAVGLRIVVSYRNSTSNHNIKDRKNTLTAVVSYRNSTSNHNIIACLNFRLNVVSYRNSTSNHNFRSRAPASFSLYLIEILHQTTTIADCPP